MNPTGTSHTLDERADILHRASQRAWTGAIQAQADDDEAQAVVDFAGYLAEFPVAITKWGTFEISWHLLERIANGETSRILV